MLKKFTAAIFDLDGTLIDSMGAWRAADAAFLQKRGLPIEADYLEALKTMHFRIAAEYTIERYRLHDENPDDIVDEWRGYVREAYDRTIEPKRGALEYLHRLKAEGVRLAVATSNEPELSGGLFARLGFDELFDAVVYTREAARPKGFPDVYLLAAERLGAQPSDCVVFEDILGGVLAAKGAGFATVAIYDASSAADWEQLQRAADAAVADFTEIIGL